MRTPASLNPPVTLVGRERELGVLRQHLAAAIAGQGSLVLIGGEAGIGKTALAEALCQAAEEQDTLVLIGRCFDLTETPPYGPWADLFERYHPAAHLPPHPTVFAEPGIVGVVASQVGLFRQVLDFLKAAGSAQPVVLLIDDCHWVDPASLDLLRFLARSLDTLPLLCLVTYRPDELPRGHPLAHLLPVLIREAHPARLDLRPLDDAAVHGLVAARYPLGEAETQRLVTYVQGRAEGNPFYLSELLRSLEETGVLHREGGRWALSDLARATLPPLLRQVIDDRVARLDVESQRLLTLAAVIGHEVPLAVWMVVSDADETALLTTIERGTQARLHVETPDGTRVGFGHALVREAMYEGISAVRRRGVHRRVGEALAEAAIPDPDAVAYHFRQAGDSRELAWLLRAADRAQNAYAYGTAAERLGSALELMGSTGAEAGARGWIAFRLGRLRRYDDPERGAAYLDQAFNLATAARDHVLAANALFDGGLLRYLAGRIRQGLIDMEAGVAAFQVLSPADQERLQALSVTLGISSADGQGTYALWIAGVGRFMEARALTKPLTATMATQTLGELVDGSSQADAHLGLAEASAALGFLGETRSAFAQARALYRAVGHFVLLGSSILSELNFAVLPYHADRVTERRALVLEAQSAWAHASGASSDVQPQLAGLPLLLLEGRWVDVRQLTQPLSFTLEPNRRLLLGSVMYLQGDIDLAWTFVRETFPDGPSSEPGNTEYCSATGLQRLAVQLALNEDDLRSAQERLEAHDRWLEWSGAVPGKSEGLLLWAQYCRAAGNGRQASDRAEQALIVATEPRQPLALLAAHRLLGELATDAGRYTDAASHLAASLSLADACAAPFERALTLLAHANLCAVTDRQSEALSLLDEVRALCIPLSARPTLDRADALASRLAAPKYVSPVYPAGLSAREVEVLRLIAQGMSTRAIATQLFVSVRTVKRHIRNLYHKIGAHNRADATAFAFRHALTTVITT